MPVAARNVAFAAMELTTLGRLHPGRVRAGIGHGMPRWMRSVGAWRSSPLTLLDEYCRTLRALMHGEQVSECGWYVWLDRVQLDAVADPVPRSSPAYGARGRSPLYAAWPTG